MKVSEHLSRSRLAAYDVPFLQNHLETPEIYLSLELKVDRFVQKPLLSLVDLRDDIFSIDYIDPLIGLRSYQVMNIAGNLQIPAVRWHQLNAVIQPIYHCFWDSDASSLHVNIGDDNGNFCVVSAQMDIDPNALFRQLWAVEPIDVDNRLIFVPMGGQIGCVVNGAGLGMLTHDLIHELGNGKITPANFLDFTGSLNPELIRLALNRVFELPQFRVLLVTIFGGLTKCDLVADRLIAFYRERQSQINAIIRFEGTNSLIARELIHNSGIDQFYLAHSQKDAILAAIGVVEELIS